MGAGEVDTIMMADIQEISLFTKGPTLDIGFCPIYM